MKTLLVSIAALVALATTPAMAREKTRDVISASAGKSHTKLSSSRSIRWYGNGHSVKRKLASKKKRRLQKIRRHYGHYKGSHRHSFRRASYRNYGNSVSISGRNFSFRF